MRKVHVTWLAIVTIALLGLGLTGCSESVR